MTDELKPCPECGSDDNLAIIGFKRQQFVECWKCFQSVAAGTDEHAAIQAWNQRANNDDR
ncbi:Lar family restriction alleviation protein [Xenorhabdus bovienii]|uniref:Lar family restriction alleviation protein n=1 Tax=Xenorhabdus bovienii TaxID=40576 RepID=UPI00056FFDFE|nr:Lar family restriction alleviation protein [Xenorhabdus bovienii]